ncbi:hypothetical protein [Gillisia marina]|uniref:hypothetical protein n=1 Tax=Gillisia marina TaxID=1167637 RepID=UPI00029A9C1F|nr:hypothetical protein [Gillisia marina]
MKEVYLAYFDYLGFKEFIENNDDEVLIRRMGHIFRDIEGALGQGKYNKPHNGIVLSDLSQSSVNCLNISDTVIFWTNECNLDSLIELIKVAYDFNWRQNLFNFPVRGSIVKGKIRIVSGKQINSKGGSYSVQCLYGKGLIKAHNKAENQNWAGTVIDQSVISDLEQDLNGNKILSDYAVKYKVPYKINMCQDEEYVLKIGKGIYNETALKNTKDTIIEIFSLDHKSIKSESVQLKIKNTLKYIQFLAE